MKASERLVCVGDPFRCSADARHDSDDYRWLQQHAKIWSFPFSSSTTFCVSAASLFASILACFLLLPPFCTLPPACSPSALLAVRALHRISDSRSLSSSSSTSLADGKASSKVNAEKERESVAAAGARRCSSSCRTRRVSQCRCH